MVAGEASSCLTLPCVSEGTGSNVEKQADMGLRRLPKKSAQTLSANADTPVYMTFYSIVGGVVSPVLANIYLHFVLDLWFDRVVKPRCEGQAHIIRFADDFVCTFQYRKDARRFYRELPERLEKFGLLLAPEKTCIHRFSRFHPVKHRRFTFLSFEFYWEADSKGTPRVWRRTARPRLRTAVKACKDWLKKHRHMPLAKLMNTMKRKVRGHYNYFSAVGNGGVWEFYSQVVALLYKWLNRRSQRRSLTWEQLRRLLERVAFPRPNTGSRQIGNRGLA